MSSRSRGPSTLLLFAVLALAPARAAQAGGPIRLRVDLSDAPSRMVHARLEIPVRPGPLTLFYPKWIPGEHGPTGPIQNLAGLTVAVQGKALPWERDKVEMYAIHVAVPEGTSTLDVSLDFLLS